MTPRERKRPRRAAPKRTATSKRKATPKAKPSRSSAGRRLLTKAEAAELLGFTERRLEQLVAEHPHDLPCVGRGARRRFPWPALREWRDKQLVQHGVRSVRPQSLEEARARKLAAEADLAEMEAAERRVRSDLSSAS